MDTVSMLARPQHAGRRDRQAPRHRRDARPRRGDVARRDDLHERDPPAPRPTRQRAARRHPGLRQGRRAAGQAPERPGHEGRRRRRHQAAPSTSPTGHRPPATSPSTSRRPGRSSAIPGSEDVAPDELFDHPQRHRDPRGARRRRSTEEVAQTMAASIVVEAANGPTTGEGPRAPARARHRGRCPTSWPTPAASSPPTSSGPRTSRATCGSASCSSSAWRRRCTRPSTTCGRATRSSNVTLRETALAVGVERIAEATQTRGLFP